MALDVMSRKSLQDSIENKSITGLIRLTVLLMRFPQTSKRMSQGGETGMIFPKQLLLHPHLYENLDIPIIDAE